MSAEQSVSLQRGSPANELTRDLRLIGRHVYYEQLSFWLNPIGAFFSVGFSVVFLTLLAIAGGTSKVTFLGGVPLIEYYVAGFSAYGVMSVCFSNLAITLVIRRENRQLMRLQLSPLPTWILVLATALNMAIISAVDIIVLLLVGALAFHVALPAQPFALIVVVLIGVACFSMMGVAASTAIPNRRVRRPGGEPRVLRPGVPVGAVLPTCTGLRAAADFQLVPGAAHDHRRLCHVQHSTGHRRLSLAGHPRDGHLGRALRGHRGTPVPLGTATPLRRQFP